MKHIELQRVAPADIEARSMELIGQELGERVFPAEQLPVVKRVIHTTADFEYADSLVFSAGAVEAGVAAIRQGCTTVTDNIFFTFPSNWTMFVKSTTPPVTTK